MIGKRINWNSAESDIALTQSLVQEEIDKGWVFEYDGTLEEAQAKWPAGVSLGKLGIAHSDGRAPRLVLDNTIRGLNPRCWAPERSTLPTCKDILQTFPLETFKAITWHSHWMLRPLTNALCCMKRNKGWLDSH